MNTADIPDTFVARGKGETIRQIELVAMVRCTPESAKYSLRVCAIADALMKFKEARGEPCTIVQVKSDLRILTDAEASNYNAARSDAAVRLLRRSHRRACDVRVEKLTDEERVKHDRSLTVTGARVALTSRGMVNRVANMGAHQRVIPGALSYRSGTQ